MHSLLLPFATHGVSMTKFESRPSKAGLWDYVFFIDIEGHIQESNVQAALNELTEKAAFVKLIGSYPIAVI